MNTGAAQHMKKEKEQSTFPQATIFLLVILLVLFQQSYLSKKTSKPTGPDL